MRILRVKLPRDRHFVRKLIPSLVLLFLIGASGDAVVNGSAGIRALDPGSITRDVDTIYWPFIGGASAHEGEGTTSGRGIGEPAVNWTVTGGANSLGAVGSDMTNLIEFDAIAPSDVFGIVDSNGTHIRIMDGDGGEIMWKVDLRDIAPSVTNFMTVSPALVDIDDDLAPEVVACFTDTPLQGNIAMFRPNVTKDASGYRSRGSAYMDDMLWNISLPIQGAIRWSSPIAHDLNADGVEDIVVGVGNRLFGIDGADGSQLWNYSIGKSDEILSPPAIYDSTGEINRIVVNSLSSAGTILSTTAVKFTGQLLGNVSYPLGTPAPYAHSPPVPMPVIGDVTGDGTADIVVVYPSLPGFSRIRVLSYSLDEVVVISNIPGTIDASCAIGDVDGDGTREIVISSRVFSTNWKIRMSAYEIYNEGGNDLGRQIWSELQDTTSARLYSPPVLCDLDDDSRPESIFFAGGWIYCLSSDGKPFWNLSVPDMDFSSAGLVGDLNPDDFTDIYIEGYFITQQAIDLLISTPEDIYLNIDPADLVEGMDVEINCLITNRGDSAASNVRVRFKDIYNGTESTIGDTVLDSVSTTKEAKMTWTVSGDGDHTISVMVDPNNDKEEIDETNNQASRVFSAAKAFPDLTVSAIHMIRGDGEEVDGVTRHLADGDPSTLVVEVENLGKRWAADVDVDLLIDSFLLDTRNISNIPAGGKLNVSFEWTPDMPGGGVVTVLADVDPAPGSIPEDDELNNQLTQEIDIIDSDPGDRSYIITGEVLDEEGDPVNGAIVGFSNVRTSENLQVTTNNLGRFSGDLALLNSGYLEGETIEVTARDGLSWANATLKAYSEDAGCFLLLTLTWANMTQISIRPQGQLDVVSDPGLDLELIFFVENSGNTPGDISLEVDLQVNSTQGGWAATLDIYEFELEPEGSREIVLKVVIPEHEVPGVTAQVRISGEIVGNSTYSQEMTYTVVVDTDADLVHLISSELDRKFDPNQGDEVEFRLELSNRGNVAIDYLVQVDSGLLPYTNITDPSGILYPGDDLVVRVTVKPPASSELLEGTISLVSDTASVARSWPVSVERALPNIRVSSGISVEPPGRYLGDQVSLSVSIENTGTTNGTDFTCVFLVNGDVLSPIAIDLIPFFGTDSEQTIMDIWTPEDPGIYSIEVWLDYENDLLETDETDNRAVLELSYFPDLSVRSILLSKQTVYGGEGLSATVVIENRGNSPMIGGYEVTLHLDSEDGQELASRRSSAILDPKTAPEEELNILFNAPEDGGDHSIYVSVRPIVSTMNETNKDNNVRYVDLVVSGSPGGDAFDPVPVLVIGGVLALLAVGVFLFIRLRGDKVLPPPGEEEDELPDTSIEPMDDELEGPPVIEMSLTGDEMPDGLEIVPVESVVVGNVEGVEDGWDVGPEPVEVSIMDMEEPPLDERSFDPSDDETFDDGLIPEV